MRKNKRSTFYMAVTADEYELPIYVADTVEELAEVCDTTKDAIYCAVSAEKLGKNNGKRKGYKFVRVKENK